MSLKSRPYDTFVGKPLTDRKIKQYILEGRYGPRLQEIEQLREEKKAIARLARKPSKKPSAFVRAIADI